jgi:hypothetical protein
MQVPTNAYNIIKKLEIHAKEQEIHSCRYIKAMQQTQAQAQAQEQAQAQKQAHAQEQAQAQAQAQAPAQAQTQAPKSLFFPPNSKPKMNHPF